MQPSSGEGDVVAIFIDKKLKDVSPTPPECCIFRVHQQLRRVNEKAYEPEIVAIGPYHRGKHSLRSMEDHKLRYLQFLLKNKDENSTERYAAAIRPLVQEALSCYEEPISLNEDQMIEMMILDGCFVIELIRKFEMPHLRDKNDHIFKVEWLVNTLQRDLMLFENQLPFFILCKLFDLIEVPGNHSRFIFLVLRFFGDLFPVPDHRREHVDGILDFKSRHFLELIHNSWLPSFQVTEPKEVNWNKKSNWLFIPSITELRDCGVKLKKKEGGSLFDIEYENGVMQIPPLIVEDRTESFFRNLIAYEQYCSDNRLSYITDYVKFMDCLIDSPSDVQILTRKRIIDNWLGDDEVVSTMFNKINDAVTGPSNHFMYAGIFNKVNIHCSKLQNRWMAKLNRNYLNSPWTIISTIAAAVLLLLTVTQTLYTVFPLNK